MTESNIISFISDLQNFIYHVDISLKCERNHSISRTLDLNIPIIKLDESFRQKPLIYAELSLSSSKKNQIKRFIPGNSHQVPTKVSKIKEQEWTETQSKFLLETVYSYSGNWKKIQKRVYKMYNMKLEINFLKEKYFLVKAQTEEKKERFSYEEDKQLLEMIELHGKNWIKISSFFEGRNPIMVKNRYYYLAKIRHPY